MDDRSPSSSFPSSSFPPPSFPESPGRIWLTLDSGWLYLISGAVLIVSAVLIPAHDSLASVQYQRDIIAAKEQAALDELKSYSTFLDALQQEDPDLVRRLAAAQLNLIPDNASPVAMLGNELDASVDNWIRSSLPPPRIVPAPAVRDSYLRRMCTGQYRLWTIAAGAALIFWGLLPSSSSSAKRR